MAGSWKVSLMDFHSRWVGRTKIVSMTEHYWCWLMPKSVPSYGKEGCFVILWLLWREVEVQTSWLRTGLRGRPEPFYRAQLFPCVRRKACSGTDIQHSGDYNCWVCERTCASIPRPCLCAAGEFTPQIVEAALWNWVRYQGCTLEISSPIFSCITV